MCIRDSYRRQGEIIGGVQAGSSGDADIGAATAVIGSIITSYS